MENLTKFRQYLRCRRRKFSVGSPLVIEGIRALSHTCFQKVCIFYGALGLGVYGCICVRSAPQDALSKDMCTLQAQPVSGNKQVGREVDRQGVAPFILGHCVLLCFDCSKRFVNILSVCPEFPLLTHVLQVLISLCLLWS